MATVAEAQQSQLRNIETATGRSIDEWVELIRVYAVDDVDAELLGWLREAYDSAG